MTFRLWLKLHTDLHATQRGAAYILQRDVAPAMVRMSRRGIALGQVAHKAQEWQAVMATARHAFIAGARQPPPATPNEARAFATTFQNPRRTT